MVGDYGRRHAAQEADLLTGFIALAYGLRYNNVRACVARTSHLS